MKTLKSHYNKLRDLIGDYVRLPALAAEQAGIEQDPESSFGCNARLQAMSKFLQPKDCDFAIDLGGNCAFFCLSLLSDGAISRALIVDHDPKLVSFGREVADFMDLGGLIRFEQESISLEWLSGMPACDVVLCQNLLHHAGKIFDLPYVQAHRWDRYALDFLKVLRSKARNSVISVNFEEGNPVGWSGSSDEKAARFSRILVEAGWTVQLQSRVFDLVKSHSGSRGNASSAARGAMNALARRGPRSLASKISIRGSQLLGSSGLGKFLRNSPLARSYKNALHETRYIRSENYFLFLAD